MEHVKPITGSHMACCVSAVKLLMNYIKVLDVPNISLQSRTSQGMELFCLFVLFPPLAWRSMLHLSLKMIWHGLYAFIRTLEYL